MESTRELVLTRIVSTALFTLLIVATRLFWPFGFLGEPSPRAPTTAETLGLFAGIFGLIALIFHYIEGFPVSLTLGIPAVLAVILIFV